MRPANWLMIGQVNKMPATVICMASAKGGSGKTVLTATFSAFLVALGKRVLMIDTDAATNGLSLMFLKETLVQADTALSMGRTAFGIYEGDPAKHGEIVKTPIGADLLPATYQFKNTELMSIESFEDSLSKAVARFTAEYDFIFLDAQAGSDPFAHLAMSPRYSKQVVIVSEYDPLSAAGVERLKGLFREELTYPRTWILLNKMLPDFVQSFSDFMEVARYASPIPWDADVVRAYARRRLALDLEKGNDFTLAVVQTLRSIIGEQIGTELDAWLDSRAASLREPVETQYRDTERELESLVRDSAHTRERRSRQMFKVQMISVGGFMVFLSVVFLTFKEVFFSYYSKESIWSIFFAILGAGAIIPLIFRFVERIKGESVEREVELDRIQRQRQVLQDRLTRLEGLRSADLSTLVKAKQRSS